MLVSQKNEGSSMKLERRSPARNMEKRAFLGLASSPGLDSESLDDSDCGEGGRVDLRNMSMDLRLISRAGGRDTANIFVGCSRSGGQVRFGGEEG